MPRAGTTQEAIYARWLSELTLDALLSIFRDLGVRETLYKDLPRNANSKNQVYLGADLSQMGKLPSGPVREIPSASGKKRSRGPIYQVTLDLRWVQPNGVLVPAPDAKLIAYPQYPEVRVSGFLAKCRSAPSHLFRLDPDEPPPNRVLVLGVLASGTIAAVALPPEAPAALALRARKEDQIYGAMRILGSSHGGFTQLARELCRIHRLGWIPAARLGKSGERLACVGPNCGGNTLEAELGIRSNGRAEPDYDGWEVKSRTVPNFERPGPTTVTLFTPEPTAGLYVDAGVEAFVRRYGYPDVHGRPNRINFGGCYRSGGEPHARTGLKIRLRGFDEGAVEMQEGGAIELVDARGDVAAEWSFAKLLDHWKTKHALAVYVPCARSPTSPHSYRYAHQVLRAEGAQFRKVLLAISFGLVTYDPGIKVENADADRPAIKRRSQFRINSKHLSELYERAELVDVCTT